MTLRELCYLHDASDASETRADYYSARVVAIIAAVNSKHGRYDPVKYMMNGRAIKEQEQQRAKKVAREPMTGDAIVARLHQIGFPVIDQRKRNGS